MNHVVYKALALAVSSALLVACGSDGVQKPNLNQVIDNSTNTGNTGTGGNTGNTGNTGSTGSLANARLSVAIEAFASAGYAQYLTEGDVNGGQARVILGSDIAGYTATESLSVSYSTVCPASVTNPAVHGMDYSSPQATGTLTLPKGDTSARAPFIITKENPSTADTTFCFTITAVDGDTNHQLMTQSNASALSATMLIKNTTADTANPVTPATPTTPPTTKATSMVNADSNLSFHKLDNTGAKVADTAKEWACFVDDNTGLVWEAKDAAEDTLHSVAGRYAYYDKEREYGEQTLEAGWTGSYQCTGMDDKCTTQAYIDKMNADKLCGITTWRLPTYHELFNITDLRGDTPQSIWASQMIFGADDTAIAEAYKNVSFWTSSPMNANPISWRGLDTLQDAEGKPSYKLAILPRTGALGGTLQDTPKSYSANTHGIILVAQK